MEYKHSTAALMTAEFPGWGWPCNNLPLHVMDHRANFDSAKFGSRRSNCWTCIVDKQHSRAGFWHPFSVSPSLSLLSYPSTTKTPSFAKSCRIWILLSLIGLPLILLFINLVHLMIFRYINIWIGSFVPLVYEHKFSLYYFRFSLCTSPSSFLYINLHTKLPSYLIQVIH